MKAGKIKALRRLLIVLILLTLAFIWGNSLLDGDQSAQVSRGLLKDLAPYLDRVGLDSEDDLWLRKLAHFCEYGLLGAEIMLLLLLSIPRRLSAALLSCVFCLVTAVIDESIQLFSDRYASASDVLLDMSGAICAVFGMWFIWIFCSRCTKTKE